MAETESATPLITKAEWTFDLAGACIYCGKKASRARTYQARTMVDAQAQADASMAAGIWHRKCGGC